MGFIKYLTSYRIPKYDTIHANERDLDMKYGFYAEICTKQDTHGVQDFSQNSNLKFFTVLIDFADSAHKCKVPVPDNNASTICYKTIPS
jgi:hypothetical protein